jgi:RNA polymerase sigma factor (sigma-70 family)
MWGATRSIAWMTPPPFQRLLDDHGRDVYGFLVASVGRTDAEDCYQETWLAALRAYPQLQHTGNLRGWLFTIAAHKALDLQRQRQRTPRLLAALGAATATAPSCQGADGRLSDDLWAAICGLAPKQRAALVLRHLLDADYATVAATMAISEAAARRNVHDGLKRLREEHGIEWST